MGSGIPIKFAERDENTESGYAYSAGESCPKKVFAPQNSESSGITPPINPRKRHSEEIRIMKKIQNRSFPQARFLWG